MTETSGEVVYKLGKTADAAQSLCAALAPSGVRGEWQLQIRAPRRGRRAQSVLLETSVTCPLASVTLGGETYALPIGWHERRRGGILCIGGARRTGTDGSTLEWEMRWLPDARQPGRFTLEMRARAAPRRTGDLHIALQTRLFAPRPWTLGGAPQNKDCAQLVYSEHAAQAALFAALDGEAGWDADRGCFALRVRRFALGGGKCVRAQIAFLPAADEVGPRAALAALYAEFASSRLYPNPDMPQWNPLPAARWLSGPDSYAALGAERLYLALPGTDSLSVQAGAPHYPLDALSALAQWNGFHPNPDVPRLVRYGSMGIAADFQVMGRAGEPEPNKGAFWDQKTTHGPRCDHGKAAPALCSEPGEAASGLCSEPGEAASGLCDEHGQAAHGIAANARIARALFLLHEQTGEPLLRQSALNICQWLILKSNADGWYDGAHVHATEGRSTDGRVIPQPCALDGAEAIHPFVLAFRATRNEVFVRAAAKIASALLPRMAEFDMCPPPVVASVVRGLLALDAEAPQPRLRAAIGSWAAWLRVMPLRPTAPGMNPDGQHSGLFDCAQAGLACFAHTRDLGFLRYALHALSLVPACAQEAWRMLPACQALPLSLAALLPLSRIDFDRHTVTLDWRCYAPDPAAEQHIQVRGSGQEPVSFLPLVCRASDQLLLLVLAPPSVDSVSVLKNGRRPLACDLLSGAFDADTKLHAPQGIAWARVGLFTIDP